MWKSTVRAVRMGLLVCPDETMPEAARLEGCVIWFNPEREDVAERVGALLDALPPDTPRCAAVLECVRESALRARQY